MVCSNLWVKSIFFPSRWRHVDHSFPFFVSSEQDDEETPWSAEIDKKLLCPKELIHKNWWFSGQQNCDARPQKQSEQSLFNPRAFLLRTVFGRVYGVWVMWAAYLSNTQLLLQFPAKSDICWYVCGFLISRHPHVKDIFYEIYIYISRINMVVSLNILVSKPAFSMVMCCFISRSRGDESWVETECRYIYIYIKKMKLT